MDRPAPIATRAGILTPWKGMGAPLLTSRGAFCCSGPIKVGRSRQATGDCCKCPGATTTSNLRSSRYTTLLAFRCRCCLTQDAAQPAPSLYPGLTHGSPSRKRGPNVQYNPWAGEFHRVRFKLNEVADSVQDELLRIGDRYSSFPRSTDREVASMWGPHSTRSVILPGSLWS